MIFIIYILFLWYVWQISTDNRAKSCSVYVVHLKKHNAFIFSNYLYSKGSWWNRRRWTFLRGFSREIKMEKTNVRVAILMIFKKKWRKWTLKRLHLPVYWPKTLSCYLLESLNPSEWKQKPKQCHRPDLLPVRLSFLLI